MLLGFTIFYKRFIRNFNGITVPVTPIFWLIEDSKLSPQNSENKVDNNKSSGASDACSIG